MARRAELSDQLLLQAEPAVIGGDADAHFGPSCVKLFRTVLLPHGGPEGPARSAGRHKVSLSLR
jgi:hypothetical protein